MVKQVKVPWAREGSGFTMLMEALIVFFAQTMQIAQISEKLKITDKRIWRVVSHYVSKALKEVDFSGISAIDMDETSRRKGHEYLTVFADIDTGRIVHIYTGKDALTLKSFADSVENHNSSHERIKNFCCDMSPAFIRGIYEHFPFASITFENSDSYLPITG
ncbi:MAG: transposase [Methanospirillum sp.]|uniref:transposase n=1 Tax=Methanospirillum sp. TaxID=45200 RepID=UPI00236AB7F5|nr:transposase [Methanospirillum sp.]MDD1728792.1 transposase [Methanospirillum sp.]